MGSLFQGDTLQLGSPEILPQTLRLVEESWEVERESPGPWGGDFHMYYLLAFSLFLAISIFTHAEQG